MSKRVLLAVAVLTLSSLVAAPVPAPAQEEPSVEEIKEEIKTPPSAGEPDGSGISEATADQSSAAATTLQAGLNVQVSQDQDPASVLRSGASELTIALASNGARSVVGWNDGEGLAFAPFVPDQPPLGLSVYGFSSDGGMTWTDGGAPPVGSTVAFGPGPQGRSATGNFVTRGDPWLDVDSRGNASFYYANLAVWEDDAALPPAGCQHPQGIVPGHELLLDRLRPDPVAELPERLPGQGGAGGRRAEGRVRHGHELRGGL